MSYKLVFEMTILMFNVVQICLSLYIYIKAKNIMTDITFIEEIPAKRPRGRPKIFTEEEQQ